MNDFYEKCFEKLKHFLDNFKALKKDIMWPLMSEKYKKSPYDMRQIKPFVFHALSKRHDCLASL